MRSSPSWQHPAVAPVPRLDPPAHPRHPVFDRVDRLARQRRLGKAPQVLRRPFRQRSSSPRRYLKSKATPTSAAGPQRPRHLRPRQLRQIPSLPPAGRPPSALLAPRKLSCMLIRFLGPCHSRRRPRRTGMRLCALACGIRFKPANSQPNKKGPLARSRLASCLLLQSPYNLNSNRARSASLDMPTSLDLRAALAIPTSAARSRNRGHLRRTSPPRCPALSGLPAQTPSPSSSRSRSSSTIAVSSASACSMRCNARAQMRKAEGQHLRRIHIGLQRDRVKQLDAPIAARRSAARAVFLRRIAAIDLQRVAAMRVLGHRNSLAHELPDPMPLKLVPHFAEYHLPPAEPRPARRVRSRYNCASFSISSCGESASTALAGVSRIAFEKESSIVSAATRGSCRPPPAARGFRAPAPPASPRRHPGRGTAPASSPG